MRIGSSAFSVVTTVNPMGHANRVPKIVSSYDKGNNIRCSYQSDHRKSNNLSQIFITRSTDICDTWPSPFVLLTNRSMQASHFVAAYHLSAILVLPSRSPDIKTSSQSHNYEEVKDRR